MATEAINVATRRVSSYSDPDLREAVAKRETSRIAEALNVPIGDPMEDTIGRLVRSPSPLPNLQEIRETPELRPLWNLLMDPKSTGKQILDGFDEFRKNGTFDLVTDRKNLAAGVGKRVGETLKYMKDVLGVEPKTEAEFREVNARLPVQGSEENPIFAFSDSELGTIFRTQQILDRHKLQPETTAEKEEEQRIKRESAVQEAKEKATIPDTGDDLTRRKQEADLRAKIRRNRLAELGFFEIPGVGFMDPRTKGLVDVPEYVIEDVNEFVDAEVNKALVVETSATPEPEPSRGRPTQEQVDGVSEGLTQILGRIPTEEEVRVSLEAAGFNLTK
jgi:hypothetical protein